MEPGREIGVLQGNGNIWVMLGQYAKVGSHNGPKCLTSCDGTLRDKRNQRSEGTTDVSLIFSQPRLCWAWGGFCPLLGHSLGVQKKEMVMQYYYNPEKKNTAAHIWVGDDTACKMLSTGGMKPGKKQIQDKVDTRQVCAMCEVNYKKQTTG